ncbi:MAG: PKD domain-containing protein [Bacteroidota bacterium]
MKRLLAYLIALLVVLVSCTDSGTNQQEELNSVPAEQDVLTQLPKDQPLLPAIQSDLGQSSQGLVTIDDGVIMYTFNDLERFPTKRVIQNPYQGLTFYDEPYFYVTDMIRRYQDGIMLVPIKKDFRDRDLFELKFELPEPAHAVELTAIWYSGETIAHVNAYDQQGNFIAADTVETERRYVDQLSIDGNEDLIYSLGFRNHPGGAYYDNLILYTVTNQPPVAAFSLPESVEATGPEGAPITLDASKSTDPDEEPLRYKWYMDDQLMAQQVTTDVTVPLGAHAISLAVTDPNEASDSVSREITVVDTTPPNLITDQITERLWPPNNKLRKVGVVEAKDLVSTPEVSITITSDSPRFSPRDWSIKPLSNTKHEVWVRATRQGKRNGRTYTVHAEASDQAGNSSESEFDVVVPHDKGH